MPEPITAKMLAGQLGLSRATVSIVLRGDAQRRKISAATEQRVLAAAKSANYLPNNAARSLRRQRSDMIGVIFPNFRVDWAERVMDGMLEVFSPTRYSPFVAMHRFKPELCQKEVLSSLQRRDEGLICFPLHGVNDIYQRFTQAGTPLVFIGDRPVELPEMSCVIWDAGAAARVAVQHLVATGRKRIAFLGIDYPMEMSQARFEAYKLVLAEAQLPLNPDWVYMPPSITSLEQIIEPGLNRMFSNSKEHPDAIFVLNDGIALPALDSLYSRGIRVPDDVAMISMGDLPLTGHSSLGLSTMREPVEEMGREAAQAILSLIESPRTDPIHRIISCCELSARRTTIGNQWLKARQS